MNMKRPSVMGIIPDVARSQELLSGTGAAQTTILQVDPDQIQVIPGHNPRGFALGEQSFQGPEFDELLESVRKNGILQPLLVRRPEGKVFYQLVAGERRLRAARAAGLATVPVLVRQISDAEMVEFAIAENQNRTDLARADQILSSLHVLSQRSGLDPQRLRATLIRLRRGAAEDDSEAQRLQAAFTGLQLPSVSTMIRSWTRYLNLSVDELSALKQGLPEGAALALVDLGDRPERVALLELAVSAGLTVSEVRARVRALLRAQTVSESLSGTATQVRSLLSDAALARLDSEQQRQLEEELHALLERFSAPAPAAPEADS